MTASRWRMSLAWALVALGILVGVVGLVAGYVRYQALDTATVRDTAEELIANDAVRDQVAETAVDQLYGNVDVEAALEQRLPPEQDRLAGPIAGASRSLADRAAERLLERPRGQALWVSSIERAHRRLVQVLDDDLTAVNTEGGYVVLNLRPLVIQVGDQVAIVGDLSARLPDDAGRVRIMKADQLETAQDLTELFKKLAIVIAFVPFVLWAAALWLARGRRRAVLRTITIGLIAIGLLVLIVRKYGGDYVVDQLVKSEAVRPAAHDTWDILTSLLADGAWTAIGVGVVALFGLWLSGATASGAAVRRELAPFLVRPEIAYPTAAVLFLLVVLWGPTAQTQRPVWLLVAAAVLALGVEVLRREVAREHPEARTVELGASARSTVAKLRGAPAPSRSEDTRLADLERLARLREQGLLTDEELTAEKSRVLSTAD